MKEYKVNYKVDGKGSYATIVSAPNSSDARKVAMGKIQGQAGYKDKRISVTGHQEIRKDKWILLNIVQY